VDIEEPTEAKEISDEVEEPDGAEDDTDDVKLAVKAAADLPADFVEWEAVRRLGSQ